MRLLKKFSDLSRRQQLRRLSQFQDANMDKDSAFRVHKELQEIKTSDPLRGTSKELPRRVSNSPSPSANLEGSEHNAEEDIPPTEHIDDASRGSRETGDLNIVFTALEILRKELPAWAIKFNVPQNAMNALLRLLRDAGFKGLPLDARTLLGTPRTSQIVATKSGEYFNYGLEHGLLDQLRRLNSPEIGKTLDINIHVDRLPIAKSSQSVLWPLLGQIANAELPSQKPFLIGVYHGYCKPSEPEEILDDFCREYHRIKAHGLEYNSTKYTVNVRAVLCDAPARAFLTCVVGHNASFACTKCEVEGDYINKRMAFLSEDAIRRTDESFKVRRNIEYHKRQNKTPLEKIGIGMVSQFPLDYMHLICLGVQKKLMALYLNGCQTVKLSTTMTNKLSQDLLSLGEWIPAEFARGVRGLDDFPRWKATEHRTFLLYVGPVVLQEYLPETNMKHYNFLHTAIRILCDPADYKHNNIYAHDLLVGFIDGFKKLYGAQTISYNVHNLLHIASDAQVFGPLDTFSCFAFENFLKDLKHLLRKGDKPLSQLSRRFEEMANLIYSEDHTNDAYPRLLRPVKEQPPIDIRELHNEIQFKHFVLSSKRKADSTCYLDNRSICTIVYIGKRDGKIVIAGTILEDPQPIPNYPCNSHDLMICYGTKWSDLKVFDVSRISKKAVKLVMKKKSYILPLLHQKH